MTFEARYAQLSEIVQGVGCASKTECKHTNNALMEKNDDSTVAKIATVEIGEDREGEKVIHYDVINQPCRDTGQLITIAINTVTYYL